MTSASAVIPSQRAPCVFVITDDFDTMVEVRVRIPFDAMFKAGLISGYHVQHRGRMVRSVPRLAFGSVTRTAARATNELRRGGWRYPH